MMKNTFKFKGKKYKHITYRDFKNILKPVYEKGTWKTLWKSKTREPREKEINNRIINMMIKYYTEITVKDTEQFVKKLLGDFTK